MPHDVGRRLFHREINIEQHFLVQPELLPDISDKLGNFTQILQGGLHAQFTPRNRVCLYIIFQGKNICWKKRSLVPLDGERSEL